MYAVQSTNQWSVSFVFVFAFECFEVAYVARKTRVNETSCVKGAGAWGGGVVPPLPGHRLSSQCTIYVPRSVRHLHLCSCNVSFSLISYLLC